MLLDIFCTDYYEEYLMKYVYAALVSVGLVSSVYANDNVEFINNTKTSITVQGNILVGETCDGPCIKTVDSFEVSPFSKKTVKLISNVNKSNLFEGGMGFSIHAMGDKSTYQVILPVSANPNNVFISALNPFSGIGKVISSSEGSLPQYTASIAQDINGRNIEANRTVISMNSLESFK